MKKKIGIMSMQRIINYGSFLQAYGLYSTIKNLGYDVEFVDYHYDGSLVNNKIPLIKKIWMKKNIFNYIKKKKCHELFKNKINNSLKELGVYEKKNYNYNLDTLVIGSDEVFNCIQGYPVGYSLELFGKNFDKSKIITYAASFGYTTYEKLLEFNILDEISYYLNKMSNISVRDNNSTSIIEKITKNTPIINFDPVLISDFSNLCNKKIDIDNYIILYAYDGRISKEEAKQIRIFAKKHGKKIISLGFYQEAADYNIQCSPFDVLTYFKNADYVITDTFHGTIFSVKMNTKFCTLVRDSNRNKLCSLLESLKQESRIVNDLNDIEKLYNQEIDYSVTNKIIEKETKKTIDYFKNNL